MLLSITSLAAQQYHVKGIFFGHDVDAGLDHELAAYYFEKYANNSLNNHKFDSLLAQKMAHVRKDNILPEDLTYLSNAISVDFASLFFIKNIYGMESNRNAQDLFRNYSALLSTDSSIDKDSIMNGYAYVFVPGLLYKRHGDKGGDFLAQRRLLDSMGLSNYLIPTNELGSVRENAGIICNFFKKLNQAHSRIIVISASKGSPDFAYALGKLMSKADTKNIKAWISIGGVLRGSKIADDHLKGAKGLFAKVASFFMGSGTEYIEDLSQEKSVLRHNSLKLPKDLLIIHYVGVPLSTQVYGDVKKNFIELSKIGPNDGLTTLTDELTPNGIVITELGLDHYFKDPKIDQKSIALLYTAHKIIRQRKPELEPSLTTN